jgi:hypothetical protein
MATWMGRSDSGSKAQPPTITWLPAARHHDLDRADGVRAAGMGREAA